MSSPSADAGSPVSTERIRLALQLGWTLAEVYGRLWQKPPVPSPRSSTRLFVSDLGPTPDERLWSAAQRLVFLSGKLFPASAPAAKEGGKENATPGKGQPATEAGKQAARAGGGAAGLPYPDSIDRIAECLKKRIAEGKGKLPAAEEVYVELNQWSREVWAELDAQAPVLSEAVTLGARLADTFWQWPYPAVQQPALPSKQTWQHLLRSQRLTAMIRQVRQVEPHLPAHTGPMLRHSLWEWGISGQLVRTPSGKLGIAHPRLYPFRSLGTARVLRQRLIKANPLPPLKLTAQEEKDLLRPVWRQLRNQMVTWEHLVFNRPLARLMRPSDWRQVRWFARVFYAFAVLGIAAVLAVLFAGLILAGARLVLFLFPFLAEPTEFKDQLALLTTGAAVLAFLATQFRRGLGGLLRLYDSIYGWLMMRKLEQRSLRPWQGDSKSLYWVWFQRLLRAEDE